MKITMKKSFAVIMALVMCVSVLFGMNLSAFAADTNNTVDYVYSGDYVYNWGERGTDAEFLSPMAIKFYSANGTTLNELLALNGSATESGVPSSALFKELHELMESNHDYITSYAATKNLFQYTDCQNSGGKISSFYSGAAIGPSWDGGWNREHTWPNSKGDKAGNGENDLMMLRPTSTSENSSRGNDAYGESSGYFNPNKFVGSTGFDLRGDVARIMLYQYIRWECTNTGSSYNPTGIFGSNGVIESKDVLLNWIEADPVDTWELGRNDAAESILGTRNVFVDYPELAFDLFNEDVPANYTSPSSGTSVEGESSGSTGEDADDTTDEDVVAPETATYVFANYPAGTQYANETLTLDDIVTAASYNSNCHFTTQLRMYNSNTSKSGGMVILSSKSEISSISLKAGYKATSLVIYSSSDGSTWSSPTSLTLITSYNDLSVKLPAGTKHIKIENTGTAQARIESITLTFAATSNDDTSEDKIYVDSNGAVVSGAADAFPADTTITVTPLTSGSDFETADNALNGIASKFKAYDITAPSQPETPVTLTLDIPSDYDTDHVCIAYIDENGEATLLDSAVDKTAMTVSAVVEHFSTYAVVDTSNVSTDGGDDSGNQGSSTTPVYQKVTSTDDLTDGDYLIVCESKGCIFDGSSTSLNTATPIEIEITNLDGVNTIESNAITNAAKFTLKKADESYTIKSSSGYYIGNTAKKNQVLFDASTPYTNTIIIDETKDAVITAASNYILRYNASAKYFRYYSSGQAAVQLYKLVTVDGGDGGNTPETPTYTITAESNNSNYGTVTLSGNVITAKAKAGYTLADGDDACTVTSGNATVVRDGDTFTVTAASDATVQINFVALPSYTATFIANGQTVATDPTYSGGKITLPEYEGALTENTVFKGWLAEGETEIRNAGSQYTLTADVTFTAQFFTVENGDAEVTEATITFDDTSKRTEFDNSHQVWKENGIVVTNNKGAATSNVADYKAPARFYKNSDLIVSLSSPNSKITKIVVNAYTSGYASALADSISDDNVAVSINSKAVTILFSEAVYSFEVTLSSGQVQVDSMNVYTIATSGDDAPKYSVTFIENGNTIGKLSAVLGSSITLPSTSGIVGEELIGWLAAGQSEVLAPGSTYAVTGDVTFTAKYKATESGDGEGSTEPYLTITTVEQLKSGTYKMAAIVNPSYYYFTGAISSKDLTTSSSAIAAAGILTVSDATDVIVTAVDGKTNTYTFFVTDKGYITCTSATSSRTLAFNQTTPCEWVASDHKDGGIVFTATINGTKTYLGTNSGASSNRIRNYKDSSTLTAGVAFFKINSNSGSSEPTGAIKGAQVSVGSDLSLSYYVNLINIDTTDNVVMKVTLDGKTTEINWDKNKIVDGKYIFTFNNIPPQCMTDNIKAELFLDGALLASLDYSIQQNAINLLAAYPNDPELKQFITDMLHYGAASQTYRGYNTNKLATAGVTGIGTPSTATPSETDKMKLTSYAAEINDVYFKSATVWFDTVNKLIIKLNPNIENLENRNIKLYLNDKPVDLDENNTYTTAEIDATKFAEVYEFTLYEGDTHIQTLEYSINAYAYSKQNSTNEKMAALALALYRYGKSAEAYAASR